jgi:signal peptidase I
MLAKLFMNALMVLMFLVAGVMLVPAGLGYQRYVILTGSMTGTYDAGSIVFDKPVPTASLKVGDPITYAPPPGASPNHALVTHRIYKITANPDGRRVFQTKGDANRQPDVWKFQLPEATQATVRFHVPYLGFAFEALSVPSVRKLVIGVPALLLALWTVVGMWREGGDVKRRREAGMAPWIPDIGRLLPQLAPLGEGGDPAAGRGTVRVAMSWPTPARGRRRGALPQAPAAPAWVPPPWRARVAAGCDGSTPHRRVVLPVTAAVRTRGARASTRIALPADWRLTVRTRPA